MTRYRPALAGLGLCLLAACQGIDARPALTGDAPLGAHLGTCWSRVETPAVIETVTEQTLLNPAETTPEGLVVEPARYRTETRQRIVKERQTTWFETPCPNIFTPELVASLQRALNARGYHTPVSGVMDEATRQAVRRYQAVDGLNSAELSLDTARKLGLVAYPRETLRQ